MNHCRLHTFRRRLRMRQRDERLDTERGRTLSAIDKRRWGHGNEVRRATGITRSQASHRDHQLYQLLCLGNHKAHSLVGKIDFHRHCIGATGILCFRSRCAWNRHRSSRKPGRITTGGLSIGVMESSWLREAKDVNIEIDQRSRAKILPISPMALF